MAYCPSCNSPVEPGQRFCRKCGYDLQKPAASSIHLAPGTMLSGRFRIIGEIGESKDAVMYRAYDTLLQFNIAIKEYFPTAYCMRVPGTTEVAALGGQSEVFFEGMRKSYDEALRLARFQNEPGIEHILNVFAENGTFYSVMELLEGETLERYLNRVGVLDEENSVRLMTPVLQALKTVHAAGMLHRDISPSNIFLTMDGTARLINFSAARFTGTDTGMTVIVENGYSPEEQYQRDGSQGPYTDVYAAAATLYRMITGTTPPDALTRRAGIEKDRRDILAEPHTLVRNVSQVRENAIMNALNVDYRDRTQDVNAFLTELNADKPAIRRYGSIKKTNRFKMPLWMKIAVPVVLAAAVTMTVLLATGVISFSRFSQNRRKPDGAVTVPEVEGMEADRAVERIEKEMLRAGTNGTQTSKYVSAGKIVLQTPAGGSYLFPGDEVLLTVSRGEGVVKPVNGVATVPYVTWATREEAIGFLEEAGLGEPKIEEEYNDYVEEGCVISQSIEYGEEVEEGASITLVISLGEETGKFENQHLETKGADGSGSGEGKEGNASVSSDAPQDESGGEDYVGNPENEGIQIQSVMLSNTPQYEDDLVSVFINVAYDLENDESGRVFLYILGQDSYVKAWEKRAERGNSEWDLVVEDVRAGDLMEFPLLAVLEDSERNRLAEDEYVFNLLTYLDPTLVLGDGMDFVDMQISGRTVTASLIYDKLQESYTVDQPGLVMYSMDVHFLIRFYDGFNSYAVSTYHVVESENARTMTLYEMERHVMGSNDGGGLLVYNDLIPDFSVNGTKLTWTFELPAEAYAENLMITGWELSTPEETMYYYNDVADGIHRIIHDQDENDAGAGNQGSSGSKEDETQDEGGAVVVREGEADGDYVRILSVNPERITAFGGSEYFTFTLEYSLESCDQAEVSIGINTTDTRSHYYQTVIVDQGRGRITMGAEMDVSADYAPSLHVIMSEHPHPDHWDPITGAIKHYDREGNPE